MKIKDKKAALSGIALTILALAVIIIIIAYNSRPIETTAVLGKYSAPAVILDAGHGGADGGAVSQNGTQEAGLNLAITLKTRDLMCFTGIPVKLTRTDESSLDFNPEKTLKSNKVADIKARLNISEEFPECDFISVHLNKFSQSRYYGAQVFFALKNERSQRLASTIQNTLKQCLDPDNKRGVKPSPDTVYLMKNISSPAVTVECGFLSNPEEEKKLKTEEYQKQIAAALTCGYAAYLKEG